VHISALGRQSVSVSATVTAVSEPSVSAVVSVTAITGLQLRRQFWLRPKPEKLVSVGLYLSQVLVTFMEADPRPLFPTHSINLQYTKLRLDIDKPNPLTNKQHLSTCFLNKLILSFNIVTLVRPSTDVCTAVHFSTFFEMYMGDMGWMFGRRTSTHLGDKH